MRSSPYFIGDSLLSPDVECVLETSYAKFNFINTLSDSNHHSPYRIIQFSFNYGLN